jgi:hypothetical protein
MDRELNEAEQMLLDGAGDLLRRTVAEQARQKAQYAPADRWQEALWELRGSLPERRPLYRGGRTALQEELPRWIAALEKELAHSKAIRAEMWEEVGT